MIRIAILSRNKNLHSIRRLLQEAKKQNLLCDVIDPLECQVAVQGRKSHLLYRGKELPEYDAVLPRVGLSVTDYALSIVKHFEFQGAFVVNTAQGISDSRDKLRSLQILSHFGARVPPTVLLRGSKNLKSALSIVKEMPVVLKLRRGTQGVGVMLLHSPLSTATVLDTLGTLDEDVLLQKFLKQGAGHDYRVFVIGGVISATMMRTAPRGDFRSNIHLGGKGDRIALPSSYRRTAIRAAQIFNLGVAGIDIMEGPQGPTILEVNSSPGFEGIEKATHKNIAAQIMKFIQSEVRKKQRNARRRKRKNN